jgi:methylenetetrahydrofolate reductase (NADPH)
VQLQKDTAHQVWGHPETVEEVGQLFANFCRGKVASLPWSEDAAAPETSVISEHLARLNVLHFLTINSQPAVNGAPSNDSVHGWGPSNGYVYQKVCRLIGLRALRHALTSSIQAYLEFFVSPSGLTSLLAQIERDPNITYYAINKRGDLRTNTHSEGPNAVTWGVFPGKEIVQPTIVEAISFMAWKVRPPQF